MTFLATTIDRYMFDEVEVCMHAVAVFLNFLLSLRHVQDSPTLFYTTIGLVIVTATFFCRRCNGILVAEAQNKYLTRSPFFVLVFSRPPFCWQAVLVLQVFVINCPRTKVDNGLLFFVKDDINIFGSIS